MYLFQVKAYASLERTVANCTMIGSGKKCPTAPQNAIGNDEAFEKVFPNDKVPLNFNSVEGRNLEFIRNFINVAAPNCF